MLVRASAECKFARRQNVSSLRGVLAALRGADVWWSGCPGGATIYQPAVKPPENGETGTCVHIGCPGEGMTNLIRVLT